MNYRLSMTAAQELTEGEQEAISDMLDSDRWEAVYDWAHMSGPALEIQGTARQPVDVAHLMIEIRIILGWPKGLKFAVDTLT